MMRMIQLTKTPKINGEVIITPPIYVRSDIPLPAVGEEIGARSKDSDIVLAGYVTEVDKNKRTYVAQFVSAVWDQGKKNSLLA